ncbi:hypothetical protein EYC84_011881 [Monilinia fructicola]|uniref:ubiquitinyl hydrolase 1 n=1 Tax=Monilinia fructicola TaxID=38448 RepID=A0A5M9J8A2_MONFR|nr:hypothetical protein EYC84_011881 [Monilinia fructicola]
MVKNLASDENDTTGPASKVISSLEKMEAEDVYAIHVEQQNAGIIIRRFTTEYSFETFELSPKNEDATTTTGRLRRYFPGPAVAVPHSRINEGAFQEVLHQCIEELVRETPIIVQPRSVKANAVDIEIRDTVDPALVTSMLTEFLHAAGRRHDVNRIQKRTREVIQWYNCLEPWRRSPRWLLLRVCLQTGLVEEKNDTVRHIQYKSFMIFFMCQILRHALQLSKSREMLFIMSMKIQRRLLKLNTFMYSKMKSEVQEVLFNVSCHLKMRVPGALLLSYPDIAALNPQRDTKLSMQSLGPYITGLSTRQRPKLRLTSVEPQCHMRVDQTSPRLPDIQWLSWVSETNREETLLALADLELWVTDHLDCWLKMNRTFETSCVALASLISFYQELSGQLYDGIPEDQSIRILTLLDLWVALDKCATDQEPLLKDYQCGFTSSLFYRLLLSKKQQMIRLGSIEKYISGRASTSSSTKPCVFSESNTSTSFSVRYFDQSPRHQSLRERIKSDAVTERIVKRTELETKLKKFAAWKELDRSSVCTQTKVFRGRGRDRHEVMVHADDCPKCIAKTNARSVQVYVHEWPLSENELEAKSVVFELDVPKVISAWRDCTYSLLFDIFSPNSKDSKPKINYYNFEKTPLVDYVLNDLGRIRLGSVTKPFIVTHYNQKAIYEATEENILKPCGMNYVLVDCYKSRQTAITKASISNLDIQKLCTIQLSPAFINVQPFLDCTEHTTNEVLAKQIDCPATLTLHQFYQFASLRCGYNLQWMNILREMETRILDLNRDEVFQLITQAAWQAGPSVCNLACRDSHQDLRRKSFGTHLLSALDTVISTVESNWQGAGAVRIVTMLTARLLSISSHDLVHQRCLQLLLRIRLITISWTRDAINMLHDCQFQDKLVLLEIRALEIALTCSGTFDVEICHLGTILNTIRSQNIFIETLITIHDRRPASTDNLPPVMRMCLRRFNRIAHRAEKILHDIVLKDKEGIDSTIRYLWPGYKAGISWIALDSPNERWLETSTAKSSGQKSLSVVLNILNGELLINGCPLARLPRNYEAHATYRQIFGEKILDVIPSTMPGMAFETRKSIFDQQVHFNMIGNELIIRTRKRHECFEVIPKHILENDFSNSFVNNYIFMRNDKSGIIQLRPLDLPWVSSHNGWQIEPFLHKHFHLSKGSTAVVDIRSPTAIALSTVLNSLESLSHIDMVFNGYDKKLEIHLPRFKLDFYNNLKDSRLVSKQFRGMFVDENQNIGTFTGLWLFQTERSPSRHTMAHVQVKIDTGSRKHCGYHDYRIDNQLGRLADNGSLLTKLYKLQLHALTSDIIPDALTGRTGTEEALAGLSSASLLSFYTLSSSEIGLLLKLRDLTPKFVYYPPEKNYMQIVSWSTLPTLSQHEAFSEKVDCIFKYAKSLAPFQNELSQKLEIPEFHDRCAASLITKAMIRNSVNRVDSFGAERFTADKDTEYQARDGSCDARRREAVYNTAKLVNSWPRCLNVCKGLQGIMDSLPSCISGPGSNQTTVVGYNRTWLDSPEDFLPNNWYSIYQTLSASNESRDKYRIMIFLSTLAFAQKVDQVFIHSLLAFATNPSFRGIQLPRYDFFDLSKGSEPDKHALTRIFNSMAYSYYNTPASKLVRDQFETEREATVRMKQIYIDCKERAVKTGVSSLMAQWPTEILVAPTGTGCWSYIDVQNAIDTAQPSFTIWFRNKEFKKHILLIQAALDNIHPIDCTTAHTWIDHVKPTTSKYNPLPTYIALMDLLQNHPPSFINSEKLFKFESLLITKILPFTNNDDQSKASELLLELIQHTSGSFETQYCRHFKESVNALKEIPCAQLAPLALSYAFSNCLEQCQALVRTMYLGIQEQLMSSIEVFGKIESMTMLPRLTHITILSLLAESHPIQLSREWRHAIVCFGLVLSTLQRLERLVACEVNSAELLMELSNPGHEGWDPFKYPDRLLLELENGILIRKDQARISKEMIDPSSGANSAMQLNMGLGKSSVIVPTVACALADKTKLCRVVVLRALSKQMMRLLVNKLGGMINRRIFFLPISRALQMNVEEAEQLREIYETCMNSGGVLLVQPEHLLSLELMGLEMVLSGGKSANVGRIINDTQAWLFKNSRDVLDESDEILNVRYELIYTVGRQQPIDLAHKRWMLVQRVLAVMSDCVQAVAKRYDYGLELEGLPQNGEFARLRILQPSVGDILIEQMARHILDQGLPALSFFRFTKTDRDTLFRFITDPKLDEKEYLGVMQMAFTNKSVEKDSTNDDIKKSLLLLRGLFAHGTLQFTFSKRFRVDFGLDLKRSSLAVPYHGKDLPAARSEFSHPETTIVLTCLSYYYEGLSESQAMECFKQLFKSDNSQGEYEKWTRNCPNVGSRFKQLSGVNLSHLSQWSENVYTNLRRSKEMIDFYLCHLVFPKEMKEFPKKISSSGWDIAQTKTHSLTGFSGTNDSKYVLPLSIQQRDLPEQLSTNAEVLACLLRPENTFDFSIKSEKFNAEVLIDLAVTSKLTVRVILDVGAQVLELRNEEVASRWLSKLRGTEVQAAVFFDSSDELCILNHDGETELLSVSPFAKQMDRCVIYLDEAHTRGTDLKLPVDFRAIVTLGPDLNKDRLTQACMRMRKLGKGQSVIFCAPKEIQRKILECTHMTQSDQIEVKHVLLWSIKNTLKNVHKCVLPWAIQGKRHYERLQALNASPGIIPDSVQEPEAQTLEERYGLGKDKSDESWLADTTPSTGMKYATELSSIRDKCSEFGFTSFAGANLHEEQERELQPEKEVEVQAKHAPSVPALTHILHPDIKALVLKGTMTQGLSSGFLPAFALFGSTSAKSYFDTSKWPGGLWITRDYKDTVGMSQFDDQDSFLRPAHWIVTFKQGRETCCVIFSPFEIQELRPLIEKYKKVTLSIYSPRLSLSLRSFENLDIHTVPRLPSSWTIPSTIMQLNLFAGQLYLRSYNEYIHLCQFLGLCYRAVQNDDIRIAFDNFVHVSSRAAFDPVMKKVCPFEESPVGFLQRVFALRRKGQSFEDSHMGKILNGELLKREDFEEVHD